MRGGASILRVPCPSGGQDTCVAEPTASVRLRPCAWAVLAHPPRVFQGKQEENDVVEKLNLFLDLLQSYKVSLAAA